MPMTPDPKTPKLASLLPGLIFLLWATVILAVLFVFQKPAALQVTQGLGALSLTLLLTFVIALDAAGLGESLLAGLTLEPVERLLLGCGLGLGWLGLAGYGLAAAGLARPIILAPILLLIWIWLAFRGRLSRLRSDVSALAAALRDSSAGLPFWLPLACQMALLLTFLLALAPPSEGFDSLLYHLTVPALWLRDGGLSLVNIPHYWYPSLVEGLFVWPMALGSDTAPQLLHLFFGTLCALLLWQWARSLWTGTAGWWAMLLLAGMPAMLWLGAWAYTDLALAFFTLAALYALWKWQGQPSWRWLLIISAFSGFAMGVKYTSFVVPLFAGAFMLAGALNPKIERSQKLAALRAFGLFLAATLLVACPWYLRNWLWTHNPVYPFVFGGPFWDAYRAEWYSSFGTGLGWDLPGLLALPFSITMGNHEFSNNFDSRIGPFFLILAPLVVWVLWKTRARRSESERAALRITLLFSIFSGLIWVYGVMSSVNLWQGRLLIPGILPFILPMALAVAELPGLNTSSLKISFIFSSMAALFIFASLLDFGLLIAVRNPLLAAIGVQTRPDYMQRFQGGYAEAGQLVSASPADARIYFLFEPRSYGMPRQVFPDPINDNLAHDIHVNGTADQVLKAWRQDGYTHVLLFAPGLEDLRQSKHNLPPAFWLEWARLQALLEKTAASPDGQYILYTIH